MAGKKHSRSISVVNPRTGQVDFHFDTTTDVELAALCGRLRKAQTEWSAASLEVMAGSETEAMKIGLQLDAGTINLQDPCLTPAKTLDIESKASKFSGIGGARTGPASILRFVRKRSYLTDAGTVTAVGF